MTASNKNIADGWLKCPYCGKKLFPVDDSTDVRHLKILCKSCKKNLTIHIEPVAT